MESHIAGIGGILAALISRDSWEISNALGQPGAWSGGADRTAVGSKGVHA